MKATISNNARAILNDPEARDELLQYLISSREEKRHVKEIKVGNQKFEVTSGATVCTPPPAVTDVNK